MPRLHRLVGSDSDYVYLNVAFWGVVVGKARSMTKRVKKEKL